MSDSITFAHTTLITDDGTFRAGDVIRSSHADGENPWSHCIILGFSKVDKYGGCYVKLARPYAYASCIGTTSPSVLTGVETFSMSISKLKFETVLTRDGNHPMISVGAGLDRLGRYPSEMLDFTTKS